VIVNLAPADVLKEGSHYDLPIALAVLGAHGRAAGGRAGALPCVGELVLDGTIAGVAGVLPAAIHAAEWSAA
jgi:magnesium chelatase family protein